jgi:carbohydrate-selective porin OprB
MIEGLPWRGFAKPRHLLGEWGGERTRLQQRGVTFDFQYVSDSLWNLKSEQPERFASWDRFRATVDIDFGELTGQKGLYFHATGLWQGGGSLGTYLGLLTSPSGMSSERTARLDSWWIVWPLTSFVTVWAGERFLLRIPRTNRRSEQAYAETQGKQ